MGRQFFLHINVSLDGYIERDDHDIDWHFADDEFEEYINDVLRSIDGMVFGRTAHEKLAEYWPAAAQQRGDRSQAPDRGVSERHLQAVAMMNQLPKYVVTDSDYTTEWANSVTLSAKNLVDDVAALKSEDGNDIAVFAGATVAQTFLDLNLLDEIRLVVSPVLLGTGTPLFARGQSERRLELVSTRTFASGAVLLCYHPDDGTL